MRSISTLLALVSVPVFGCARSVAITGSGGSGGSGAGGGTTTGATANGTTSANVGAGGATSTSANVGTGGAMSTSANVGVGGAASTGTTASSAAMTTTGSGMYTCTQVSNAVGCCDPNGVLWYCSTTGALKSKMCAAGTVCTWNTTKSYYGCAAGSPVADPSGTYPIACQ